MTSTLFLGGARSGKSGAATALASAHGGRVAVVVFGRRGTDDEFDRRIADHCLSRPSSWLTIEPDVSSSWTSEVSGVDLLVVDCVGTWLSALAETVGYAESERTICAQCVELAANRDTHVIFVSNEVGSSLTPLSESGRSFTDALGRINQLLGATCDQSYLCIAGFNLPISELSVTPDWRTVE